MLNGMCSIWGLSAHLVRQASEMVGGSRGLVGQNCYSGVWQRGAGPYGEVVW